MEADEDWEQRYFPSNFSRFSHCVAYLRREPEDGIKKVLLDGLGTDDPGMITLKKKPHDGTEEKDTDLIVVVKKEPAEAPPFGKGATIRQAASPSTSAGVGWYSVDRPVSAKGLMKFSEIPRAGNWSSASPREPVWSDDAYLRKHVRGSVEMGKMPPRRGPDLVISGELLDIPDDKVLSAHPREPQALAFAPPRHCRRRLPAHDQIRIYDPNPDYVMPRAKGAVPMEKVTPRYPILHPPLPHRGRPGPQRWNDVPSTNPGRMNRMSEHRDDWCTRPKVRCHEFPRAKERAEVLPRGDSPHAGDAPDDSGDPHSPRSPRSPGSPEKRKGPRQGTPLSWASSRPTSAGKSSFSELSTSEAPADEDLEDLEPPENAPASAQEFLGTAIFGTADPLGVIFAPRTKPQKERRISTRDTFYGFIGRAPNIVRAVDDGIDYAGMTARQRVALECDKIAASFSAQIMARSVMEHHGDIKLAMPRIELH